MVATVAISSALFLGTSIAPSSALAASTNAESGATLSNTENVSQTKTAGTVGTAGSNVQENKVQAVHKAAISESSASNEVQTANKVDVSAPVNSVSMNKADAINNASTVAKDTDYSLNHIANSYSYYGKGNLEGVTPGSAANHQVGPIAVGGNAHVSYIGRQGTNQPEYNYIRGTLTLIPHGNIEAGPAKDGTIVVGTENKGKSYSDVAVAYDDDHIDFNEAFASIDTQIDDIVNNKNITWKDMPSSNFGIKESGYYKVSFSHVSEIGLDGANLGNVVILVTDNGDLNMPRIIPSNLKASEEKNATGIIWIFPYASSLYVSSMSMFGTVIIPHGDVTMESGNYNGCLIVGGDGHLDAEGHLWSYNGTVLPKVAKKTVKPHTPSSPAKPAVPTIPEQPTTPEQPTKPSSLNKPETPVGSTQPSTKTTEKATEKTQDVASDIVVEQKGNSIPKMDDVIPIVPLGIGALIAGASVAILLRLRHLN